MVESKTEWVREVRFDWELGLSLLPAEKAIHRQQGIRLLTLSNYPIADGARKEFLLDRMTNSKSDDEDEAWSEFLTGFPIQTDQEAQWCSLLEDILEYPQHYSGEILSGAMERYQELVKNKDVDLLEQDEKGLGLP